MLKGRIAFMAKKSGSKWLRLGDWAPEASISLVTVIGEGFVSLNEALNSKPAYMAARTEAVGLSFALVNGIEGIQFHAIFFGDFAFVGKRKCHSSR